MDIRLLRETFSPWIDDVIRDFSKCLSDYETDKLHFLHKNIEKEIYSIYFSPTTNQSLVQKRAKTLYSALTYLYNHFCWKITHQKDCSNVKTSSVKLLSQIIKTGLVLSRGQPKSEWINRVLTAIRLFTGDQVLIYDSLLLVNLLKPKYHRSYIVILKHVLTNEDQECIKEPLVYMKVIFLFRRLKALLKNKMNKNCITAMAAKIKPPANLISWLMSVDHNIQPLKYKTVSNHLMKKSMDEALLKKIRCIALSSYNFESDSHQGGIRKSAAAQPSEMFVIDSASVNDHSLNENEQIRGRKMLGSTNSEFEPVLELKTPGTSKSSLNKKQKTSKGKKTESLKSECKAKASTSYINTYSNLVIENDSSRAGEHESGSDSESNYKSKKPIDSLPATKINYFSKCEKTPNSTDFVRDKNVIEISSITISDSAAEKESNEITSSKSNKTNSRVKEKSCPEFSKSKNLKRSKMIESKNNSKNSIENKNKNPSCAVNREISLMISSKRSSISQKEPDGIESDREVKEDSIFYVDAVPKETDLESKCNKKRKSLQDQEFLSAVCSKKKKNKHNKSIQASVNNLSTLIGDQLENCLYVKSVKIEMDSSKQTDANIGIADLNYKRPRDHCIDKQASDASSMSVDSDNIKISPDSFVSDCPSIVENSNVVETVIHRQNPPVSDSRSLSQISEGDMKNFPEEKTHNTDLSSTKTNCGDKQFSFSVVDSSPSYSWVLKSSKQVSVMGKVDDDEKFVSNPLEPIYSPKKSKPDSDYSKLTSNHSPLKHRNKDFDFEKLEEIPDTAPVASSFPESKRMTSPSRGLKRKLIDSKSENFLNDSSSTIPNETYLESSKSPVKLSKFGKNEDDIEKLKLSVVEQENFEHGGINKSLQIVISNSNDIDLTMGVRSQSKQLNETCDEQTVIAKSIQPEMSESSKVSENTGVVNKDASSTQNIQHENKEMLVGLSVVSYTKRPDSPIQTNSNVSEQKTVKHEIFDECVSDDNIKSSDCQTSGGKNQHAANLFNDLPLAPTVPKTEMPAKESVISYSTNEYEISVKLNQETNSVSNKYSVLELECVDKSDSVKNAVNAPKKDIMGKQFNSLVKETNINDGFLSVASSENVPIASILVHHFSQVTKEASENIFHDKCVSLSSSSNKDEQILSNSSVKSCEKEFMIAPEIVKSSINASQTDILENQISQVAEETQENYNIEKGLLLVPSISKEEPISADSVVESAVNVPKKDVLENQISQVAEKTDETFSLEKRVPLIPSSGMGEQISADSSVKSSALECVNKSDSTDVSTVNIPIKDVLENQLNQVAEITDESFSLEKSLPLVPTSSTEERISDDSSVKSSVLECVNKSDSIVESAVNIPKTDVLENQISQVAEKTDENFSLEKRVPLIPSSAMGEQISADSCVKSSVLECVNKSDSTDVSTVNVPIKDVLENQLSQVAEQTDESCSLEKNLPLIPTSSTEEIISDDSSVKSSVLECVNKSDSIVEITVNEPKTDVSQDQSNDKNQMIKEICKNKVDQCLSLVCSSNYKEPILKDTSIKSSIILIESVNKSGESVGNMMNLPPKDISENELVNETDKISHDKGESLSSSNSKEATLNDLSIPSSTDCVSVPDTELSKNELSSENRSTSDEYSTIMSSIILQNDKNLKSLDEGANFSSVNTKTNQTTKNSDSLPPSRPKSCMVLQSFVKVDLHNHDSGESIKSKSEFSAKDCQSSVLLEGNKSNESVKSTGNKSQNKSYAAPVKSDDLKISKLSRVRETRNSVKNISNLTSPCEDTVDAILSSHPSEVSKPCLNLDSVAMSEKSKSVADPLPDLCIKSCSHHFDTVQESVSHQLDQEKEKNYSNRTFNGNTTLETMSVKSSDISQSDKVIISGSTESGDLKDNKIDSSCASSDSSVVNREKGQSMQDGYLHSNDEYIVIDEAECQSEDNFTKNDDHKSETVENVPDGIDVCEKLETGDKTTECTEQTLPHKKLVSSCENRPDAKDEGMKNSDSKADKLKKFSLTQYNKNSNKDVDEVKAECSRITRSSSKKYNLRSEASHSQSGNFPFDLKNDKFLSFAEISSGVKPVNNCDSPSKSKAQIKNFAFAASTELFSSYRCHKTKSTVEFGSKDDNSSQCNELSDDERSQDLSSDDSEGKTFSDHSSPEINECDESENVQDKHLLSPNSTQTVIKSPEENIQATSCTETNKFACIEDEHTLAKDIETCVPSAHRKDLDPVSFVNHVESPTRKSLRLKKKADTKCETLYEDPINDSVTSKSQENISIPVAEIKQDPSEITIPNSNNSESAEERMYPVCVIDKLDINISLYEDPKNDSVVSMSQENANIPVAELKQDPSETIPNSSNSESVEKGMNPVCVIDKLDLNPCGNKKSSTRKTKSKEILHKIPSKRYALRCQKPKQCTDESSTLGIDISQLHLDSTNSRKSIKNYPKLDEKLLAKLKIDFANQQEVSSSIDKPSEGNMPSYNLRHRKSILAPAKFT